MSIFKEPYDPAHFHFSVLNAEYDSIYQRRIVIHAGETKINSSAVLVPSVLLAATIGLSLLWWPILLLNIVTLIVWTVFPKSRINTQKKMVFLAQTGQDNYRHRTVHAPLIKSKLAEKSPIYKEAVEEWISAIRAADNVAINREQWIKYLKQTEALVAPDQSLLMPNFKKTEILKELMPNE